MVKANGEVQTSEEAQVFVHDLDRIVTVQLLEDTPAVLSLGKLCEEHGYSCEWARGQKPQLTKSEKRILCKTENFVPVVVLGLSSSSGKSSSSTSSPARLRSDGTHAQASGDRGDPPKIKNKNRKRRQQSSKENSFARSPRVVTGVHR